MLIYELILHLLITWQDMQMSSVNAFYANLSVWPCHNAIFLIISLKSYHLFSKLFSFYKAKRIIKQLSNP